MAVGLGVACGALDRLELALRYFRMQRFRALASELQKQQVYDPDQVQILVDKAEATYADFVLLRKRSEATMDFLHQLDMAADPVDKETLSTIEERTKMVVQGLSCLHERGQQRLGDPSEGGRPTKSKLTGFDAELSFLREEVVSLGDQLDSIRKPINAIQGLCQKELLTALPE